MRLRLSKNQLDRFRKKARANPNEIMAILLGKFESPHVLHIMQFKYPALKVSTPGAVEAEPQSLEDICQHAQEEGYRVVGSIHSHPNYDAVMSKTDYDDHKQDGDYVSGIVSINYGRTRVFFWTTSSCLPLEFDYI